MPQAVAVAHREAMVAEALAAALGRYPEIVPIVASSVADVERRAEHVDAAVLDESMPGAELTSARLRRLGIRVVLLCDGDASHEDDGVHVSLGTSVATLATALFPAWRDRPSMQTPLTPREREVLSLVARGLAAKQVARHLGISHKTVERHKTKIFAKLGVPNQAAAVNIALTRDLTRRTLWA
jgi:DNA-binding NarL/FixJ family response regulator